MTAFWEWVDTFGGPVMLFIAAYGIFLVVALQVWRHSRERADVCERCGRSWRFNPNGSAYHFCSPPKRQAYP